MVIPVLNDLNLCCTELMLCYDAMTAYIRGLLGSCLISLLRKFLVVVKVLRSECVRLRKLLLFWRLAIMTTRVSSLCYESEVLRRVFVCCHLAVTCPVFKYRSIEIRRRLTYGYAVFGAVVVWLLGG